MSNTRKDLSDQERENGEDLDSLNISLDDIFNEMDQYVLPPIEPTDITIHMIAERYNISKTMAYSTMDRMAKSGKYEKIKVRGENNSVTLVLRRVL